MHVVLLENDGQAQRCIYSSCSGHVTLCDEPEGGYDFPMRSPNCRQKLTFRGYMGAGLTSSIKGRTSLWSASLSIRACARLLISSEVHAKCVNSEACTAGVVVSVLEWRMLANCDRCILCS